MTLATDSVTFGVAGRSQASEQTSAIAVWERWNDYGIGLLRKGDEGANRGELRQAEHAFRAVVAEGRPDGHVNLARVYLKEGRLEEAQASLAAAVAHDPPAAPWTIGWFSGLVNKQNGFLDEAIADFRKVVELDTAETRKREFDFSQDYDLMLRVMERTDRIEHLPEVLYHWRKAPSSTALSGDAKPTAHGAGARALQAHLDRLGIAGEVVDAGPSGLYRIKYRIAGNPRVSILMPTRDADSPLPMIRDPRLAFDQLFGVGATPEERAQRRAEDKSILDLISAQLSRLNREIGAADRARVAQYLDEVREIERRIQKVEEYNRSGEARELPMAPVGVPDSFDEHVALMFDLQVLAFQSDTTRVFSFKMGRDASSRVYPNSGVSTGFHPASHHGDREDRILTFAKINTYHVGTLPYFLKKLKETPDGDGNLLDNTLVIYGSPMGDSNIHNHKRCPLFFVGKAGGALKGGLHIKAADGTPMANAMLAVMQGIGVELASFGDSTRPIDLNELQATTAAAE